MDKKEFSDILNNTKDLTLVQLLKIVGKIKWRVLLSLFLFFVSTIGGAFAAGKYSEQKDAAVMLQKPFSMFLKIEDEEYRFDTLVLIEDPTLPLDGSKIRLSLRHIVDDFDIIPLGGVIAEKDNEDISKFWKMIISDAENGDIYTFAISNFNWNGHKGDYDFWEEFIEEDLVWRHYKDGCILEYEVDHSTRRSVPDSFHWVEKTH